MNQYANRLAGAAAEAMSASKEKEKAEGSISIQGEITESKEKETIDFSGEGDSSTQDMIADEEPGEEVVEGDTQVDLSNGTAPPQIVFDKTIVDEMRKALELSDKIQGGLMDIAAAADLLAESPNYNLVVGGEVIESTLNSVKTAADNLDTLALAADKVSKKTDVLSDNTKSLAKAVVCVEHHIKASKDLLKEYTEQLDAFNRVVERTETIVGKTTWIDLDATSVWKFFLLKIRHRVDTKTNNNTLTNLEKK